MRCVLYPILKDDMTHPEHFKQKLTEYGIIFKEMCFGFITEATTNTLNKIKGFSGYAEITSYSTCHFGHYVPHPCTDAGE